MQKYEYNGIVVTAASKEEAVMKIKASAKGKTGKKESMATAKSLASAKARIKKLANFGDKYSVTASAEHKRSEYVVTVSAPSSHYLNAVHTIASALITPNCDFSRSRDGFYTIRFRTEDEAKKAFKEAYDTIKDEHSPLSAVDSLGDDGLSLSFDGASAITEVVDATLYMLFGYPQESDFGVKDLSSRFTQDELERIKDKGMSPKDFRTVAEALRGKGATLVDYVEDEDGDKKISYEAIENMAHVGTRSELEKEGYLFGSIVVAAKADASTRGKTSRLLDTGDEKKGKKARACKGSRKATASSLAEYYGIPGLRVRNHGSWSDSELVYKGMCFSEAEVGDSMWDLFNSDVEEGYFDKEGMDEYDAFDKFCKEHTDNILEYVESSCNSQLEDKMTLSLELSEAGSDHGEEIESAFRKAGLNAYAEHYEGDGDGTEYISGIEVSGELKKVLEVLHGIDDQYIHQFNEKFEGGFGGLQKDYGYRKSDVYGYEYLYGNQATAGVKDLPRKATAGMRPTLLDRTVSHGTARTQDVMPRVLEVLKEIDPSKHKEFLQENPELKKALGKDGAEYWNTEDCMFTYDELFNLMDSFSPQGYYFGAHPGDASDIGYWNCGGECEAGAKKLPRKAHASTGLVSDELYEAHGAEYLSQDGIDEPVGMDMFDEFMMGKTPLEIVQRTFNGYDDYRGDGEGREPFNPNHDYFYVNGYGNVVSLPADSLVAYLKRVIDEDDFAEWLRGEGYMEGTPDLM